MRPSDSVELPQGTLDLLILRTIALEPLHGWAVSQRIQRITRDVVQIPQGSLYPALRTANDAPSYRRDIERAVWSVDPGQPIDGLGLLTEVLTQSAGDQRFQTVLLSSFALLGLLLAMIGVYGVTSAAVTARIWEIGVRLALGATSASVVLNMLFESAKRILLGVVAGIAVFFALGRIAASLLYNTSFTDPLILIAAILPLVLTAFVICYLQARQLGRVDPVFRPEKLGLISVPTRRVGATVLEALNPLTLELIPIQPIVDSNQGPN